MIFYIVKDENQKFYEFVVATSYFDLLSKISRDFKLIVDNSFESIEKNIRIHEISKIKKELQVSTFNNAAETIRNEWLHEVEKCYRNVIEKADFNISLEKIILNWNIQMIYLHIYFFSSYMLIIFNISIFKFLNNSHEISCFFVWIVVNIMTLFLLSTFWSENKTNDFDFFEMFIQTYSKY